MIDKVLILGLRRAGEIISDSEISQMIGRCGRSYTESGEATLIVPSEDEDTAWKIINSKPKPVTSSLCVLEETAFHFLPNVLNKENISEVDFLSWYSRSLSFKQERKVEWRDLECFLMENGCLSKTNGRIVLSELGKIACNYYIKPNHAFLMNSRVSSICDLTDLDTLCLSWILSTSPIFKDLSESPSFQEYSSSCSGRGFYFDDDFQDVSGYIWKSVLDNLPCKGIASERNSFSKDLGRMVECVKKIFTLNGKDASFLLDRIKISSERKIPFELSILALELIDAKKSILLELDSFGISSKSEIREKEYQINKYATKSLKQYLSEHKLC